VVLSVFCLGLSVSMYVVVYVVKNGRHRAIMLKNTHSHMLHRVFSHPVVISLSFWRQFQSTLCSPLSTCRHVVATKSDRSRAEVDTMSKPTIDELKSIWRRSLMVRGPIFPINLWPFRAMRCNFGQPQDYFDNQKTETPKWGFSTCPKLIWPLRCRSFFGARRMAFIRFHFNITSIWFCVNLWGPDPYRSDLVFSKISTTETSIWPRNRFLDRCERGIQLGRLWTN
jgi:hypothetical protein